MRFSRLLAPLGAATLGLTALTSLTAPAANAAYYNEYSDVASTPDTGGNTAAQGFAAGATYLYSIKTNSAETRSVIYRINKTNGSRVVMKNGTNKTSYNTWLGHANDMTIVDIAGKHYFFVVTMVGGKSQLVKLKYDGTTYTKVGSYAVKSGKSTLAVSGISRVSVTSTAVKFLFKSGRHVYTGSIKPGANSGTVALKSAFLLNVAKAKVNGAVISDLPSYSSQGFFYDTAKSTIYMPLTKANRSVVLVYTGVNLASTAEKKANSGTSFRITSSKYQKFEIESVGLSGGKLYFNTNRATAKAASDGVHVFKGYVVR